MLQLIKVANIIWAKDTHQSVQPFQINELLLFVRQLMLSPFLIQLHQKIIKLVARTAAHVTYQSPLTSCHYQHFCAVQIISCFLNFIYIYKPSVICLSSAIESYLISFNPSQLFLLLDKHPLKLEIVRPPESHQLCKASKTMQVILQDHQSKRSKI